MILPLNKGITHIIQKQSISIGFENPGNALGLQNRIAELFYERVQPCMETLFDEMADEAHIINIETLEIDCGIIKGKHWEDEWVDTILFQLKQALNALPKDRINPDHINNPFFFFLETGHLPWNRHIDKISQLEESVVLDSFFFKRLKEIMSDSAPARQRLINQFSDNFFEAIDRCVFEWEGKSIEAYYRNGYALPIQAYNIGNIILEIFMDSNKQKAFVKKETIDKNENSVGQKQIKTDKSKEIYIGNAGLVLLHPFLPALFEELQLIKDNQWINEESQQKAVLIIQFLVTGEEQFPEFELPLNKIICGIDLKSTLAREIAITAEVKTACEGLLTQVITHWSALKNTGIESFRHTFLQRNGKLSNADNGWLLEVERQGVDVLLGSLPWGIGVIRLPWMNEIIFTEWV